MSDARTTGGLTRRNFVRVAAGMFTPLVRVASGHVLPAQAQELTGDLSPQASDAGQSTDTNDPQVVITLVLENEAGIHVGDLSIPSIPAVPGARVRLSSRYNGKALEEATDDEGNIKFRIEELSENPDGVPLDRLEHHTFNGTIEMTCAGYRDFVTGLVRVVGGEALFVGTQPLKEGEPYPRLVGFDEWDALYTQNEFIVAEGNTSNHDLRVQWANVDDGQVTIAVAEQKSGRKLCSRNVTARGGIADTTFTDTFLQKGASHCITPGETLVISLTQGDLIYSAPLNLLVSKGAAEKERDDEDVKVEPFAPMGPASGFKMKWPKDVPILGGSDMALISPSMPVNVSFNPWGYLQITIKSPSWGYKTDEGTDTKNKGWGTYPKKFAEDQWKAAVDKAKKMADKTQRAIESGRKVAKVDTSGSLSADVSFQINIGAQWDFDKYKFEGDAGLDLVFAFSANFTASYLLGFIPVFVTFALNAGLTVTLSVGFVVQAKKNQSAIEAVGLIGEADWGLANAGVTITINLTPSMTAGVGIEGIFTIGLRAQVVITMVFGWPADADEDKPMPHQVYSFSLQLHVVITFLCMSHSWQVLDVPLGGPFDNWKSSLSMSDLLAERGSLQDVKPITEDMLKTSCEFVIQRDENSLENVERPPFQWSAMREEDITAYTSDQMEITYTVYRMVEDEVTDTGDADVAVVQGRNLTAPIYDRTLPGSYFVLQPENNFASLPEPGVLGLGREGGIVPSSDTVLREPVFCDPRMRVVTLSTKLSGTDVSLTVCLRITSVNIGSDNYPTLRTRLVLSILDAAGSDHARHYVGSSVVVDFDVDDLEDDVIREDMFDYDLDVALSSNGGNDIVHVVLVSGTRPYDEEDESTYHQRAMGIASNLYFTYLCFSSSNVFAAGGMTYITKQTRSAAVDLSTGLDDDYCHLVSNLRVATDGSRGTRSLLVCYLDRYSKDPEALLFEEGMDASCRVSMFIVDLKNQLRPKQVVPDRSIIDQAMSDLPSDVYEFYLSPCMDHDGGVGKVYTLNLIGPKNSHFYIIGLRLDNASDLTVIDSIRACSVENGAVHLIPWPGQDRFLCSYPSEAYRSEMKTLDSQDWNKARWCLHSAKWSEQSGAVVLETEAIGPEGFSIKTFGVNAKGTFIFWAQTRDEDEEGLSNRVYDSDMKSFTCVPEKALNQLVACRVRNKRFSEPFVAAEIPHALDSIDIVQTFGEVVPLAFLSRELYRPDANVEGDRDSYHSARLWFTSVPHLMCATVIDCTSPMPMFKRGGIVRFHVTIRNDGNSYLKGCKVEMELHENIVVDEDGRVISETVTPVPGSVQDVDFKKQIIESIYNPMVDGELQKTEPDGSLAPGKCSVFELFVKIPEDWGSDGKTTRFHVSFRAFKPVLAPEGSMGVTTQSSSDMTWPSDGDVEYQTYALETPVIEPNRISATPTEERYQHYMTTLSLATLEIPDDQGPSFVTVRAKGDDSDDKGQGGGGSSRPHGWDGSPSPGGYRWYESMYAPYVGDPVRTTGRSAAGGSAAGSVANTVAPTLATTPVQAPAAASPATGGSAGTATSAGAGVASGQAAGVPQTSVAAPDTSALATTADDTSLGLPAALAVAGAAIVAYERRRAQNEED